jgi:hypothetical protein
MGRSLADNLSHGSGIRNTGSTDLEWKLDLLSCLISHKTSSIVFFKKLRPNIFQSLDVVYIESNLKMFLLEKN